jgi:hypothetical protein
VNAAQWASVSAAAAAFLTGLAGYLKARQAHRKMDSHATWHDQQPPAATAPAPSGTQQFPSGLAAAIATAASPAGVSDVAAFDAAVAGLEAAERGSTGPLGEPLPGPVVAPVPELPVVLPPKPARKPKRPPAGGTAAP